VELCKGLGLGWYGECYLTGMEAIIYKDRQGGRWVYWLDSDGVRWYVSEKNVAKYLRQGYRLVELVR